MKRRKQMRKKATLSKILKLRDNRKKEIEIELQKAADKVYEEESKLHALVSDYTENLKFFNEKNDEGSIDVSKLNSYYDFFSSINARIKEQEKKRADCQDEFDDLKNTLVKAHKDKKAIEILSDKITKRGIKERATTEQKENDYLALIRRLK
jgi:flagellar export protein FliJ